MYTATYEADFECAKGHKFVGEASPLGDGFREYVCPVCYQEWIAANVPKGKQIGPARLRQPGVPLKL